jgi:copper ion binding protein
MPSPPRNFVGTTTFRVDGMTCGHCVHAVTSEIGKLAGVQTVSIDLPTGMVCVTTAEPVDRADVAAAVDEAGYTLVG